MGETFSADQLLDVSLSEDGSNRAVFIMSASLDWMRYETDDTFKYSVLKERVFAEHVGFSFDKKVFFYRPFNRKISQLLEGGIIDHYKSLEPEFPKDREVEGPVVLSLTHIHVWFYIWLIGLSLSLLSFVGELIVSKVHEVKSL